MQNLFEMMLDASFSGSVVILAVMLLRLLLKKAPRSLFCLLWLLVGLRLMIPLEIESSLSLQPRREEVAQTIIRQVEFPNPEPEYAPDREEVIMQQSPMQVQPQAPAVSHPQQHDSPQWNWKAILPYIWLIGILVMCIFSVHRYLKLKCSVKEAWRTAVGIWETDRISTAFVFGFLPPKIYLPAHLSAAEKQFILDHERTHITRHDHWYKLIGYGVLAIHWFNPLVWIGYSLMCQDIEYACDASVVQNMSLDERKRYSEALLNYSTHHGRIAACPVAFAESDPKGRIRAVLSYRKPGFWISLAAVIAFVFVAICLMTSPKSTFSAPEIPSLEAPVAVKSRRLAEPFNPNVITYDLELYETDKSSYCFDSAIPKSEREKCVFYTEGILSRFDIGEKHNIVLLSDYDGAWISSNTLYLGGPFDCTEYGAKLITLLCGGYANYGAAYGYAEYIAVEEGWKTASTEIPNLTHADARDLNWLCFREGFVSKDDIQVNKYAATSFARDYIAACGEADYRELLVQSGNPETVINFNAALSQWYAASGLEYTPTEILYSMGGSYHDYLVKCRYATFYLPKDWENYCSSELTKDPAFLHKNYTEVKACFETNAYQMGYVQQSTGFTPYNNNLTVEFMYNGVSYTRAAEQRVSIHSIEDLPMLYVYYITLSPLSTRDYGSARIDSRFYIGMAKYIAMNNPNLYESQMMLYMAEHGDQAGIKDYPGWNENLLRILKDETDPYQILKKRWDYLAYFLDAYYDENGLACSLPLYLIEKYGYETMFNYVYITGKEPIELDLVAERDAWIAHLEETYKGYPKFADYQEEERVRDPHLIICTDESCTDQSHDHSEIRCKDITCTNPAHDHSDQSCTDSTHGHHHSNH